MMCRIKKSIMVALAAAGIVFAQTTQQWQSLYPAYSGLAFGDGKFVAVSGDGLIRTSSDGAAWSQYFVRDGGNSRNIYSVAYGGGGFMATQSGTSCLRSVDGSNWSLQGMGFNEPVRYLTSYGNDGGFVGVGDEGTTYLFEDGAWDRYEAKQAGNLSHVAYGGNGFIIVGSDVEYSANAKGWQKAGGASVSGGVSVVAFGNGKFVALAKNGGTVLTTDGYKNNWTSATASDVPPGMTDMIFGGGKFVAVGKAGNGCVSSDGASWSASTGLNPDDDFTAVKYNGSNTFLAVGAKGSVYKSADGKAWTKLAGSSLISYKQITYGGGKFVAVGDSGVSVSSNGKDWERKSDAKGLRGVAFGANKFVAVGDSGTIISSDDGNKWTPYDGVDNTSILTSVAFGNGVFVVGGRTGGTEQTSQAIIIASDDGQSWSDQSGNLTGGWTQGIFPRSLCFGKGIFIAAIKGSNEIRLCVRDAVDEMRYWNKGKITTLPDGYDSVSVTYANEKFVAVGTKVTGESMVLNSADGESWQALPEDAILKKARSATYAKNTYIAVGDSGNVYAYVNNSWYLQGKATNRILYTVYSATYSGQEIVLAAGAKGAILYTDAAPTSVKHVSAPRAVASSKTGVMSIRRTGRVSSVTLSFTPNSAGTIAVYSLSGRQLYKTRLGVGERSASLPERAVSNGSVIVRYSGGDGKIVSQRFQFVR